MNFFREVCWQGWGGCTAIHEVWGVAVRGTAPPLTPLLAEWGGLISRKGTYCSAGLAHPSSSWRGVGGWNIMIGLWHLRWLTSFYNCLKKWVESRALSGSLATCQIMLIIYLFQCVKLFQFVITEFPKEWYFKQLQKSYYFTLWEMLIVHCLVKCDNITTLFLLC